MRKAILALAAVATIAFASIGDAQARNRGGAVAAGVIGGLAAGAIIGGAIASSRPAYAVAGARCRAKRYAWPSRCRSYWARAPAAYVVRRVRVLLTQGCCHSASASDLNEPGRSCMDRPGFILARDIDVILFHLPALPRM